MITVQLSAFQAAEVIFDFIGVSAEAAGYDGRILLVYSQKKSEEQLNSMQRCNPCFEYVLKRIKGKKQILSKNVLYDGFIYGLKVNF